MYFFKFLKSCNSNIQLNILGCDSTPKSVGVGESESTAPTEKQLYNDIDKSATSSSNSLFSFGGARVQDYLNTLSHIQQLQDRGGSSNSITDNCQGNKMSTSSSSPSYSPKLYSSQQNNLQQQNVSRSCSSNTVGSNPVPLPFSPEQTIKIINCSSSSSSGDGNSNDSSNSSSRSGSSSNILSSNTGAMCNTIMEGIRGVSYHHLTSSVSTTATGTSSKYRLPSRYPSSSCPGSNNSSISSPYSPSSQHNLHPPHLCIASNSSTVPITVLTNIGTETLRTTPPSVGIDAPGPTPITTRPPSCSPVDLTSTSKQLLMSESSLSDRQRFESIRISRNAIEKAKMDMINPTSLIHVQSTRNGGPLTRSRKRKMGGDQSSNIHLNMPTAKNASVTITLQVNSASSTSSSTSNNDDELDNAQGISNNTAQIVPTNRATAAKLQRRGYFEDMPISRLGLSQQNNHSALAMMSSNLSSQSFCSSEVVNSPSTTTTHASLAVLTATDTNRISSGGSDEHIQNIRSAFASMPTSITTAAATAGGAGTVSLGCRGNAAVTITID
jgi:hypothetical protein